MEAVNNENSSSSSNSSSNSSEQYMLASQRDRRRSSQRPLYCPAVLRKEGTSIARARANGTASSTACAPFHPHSRWLQLNTPEAIQHAEQVLKDPSEHAVSPVSPGVAALSPQGTLLPMSQWEKDSAVSICQARDCTTSFPPASATSPSAPASAFAASDSDAGGPDVHVLSPTSILGGITSILAHPFTARRHHCRACGKIFCSAHSSQSLPLQCASQEQADAERARTGLKSPNGSSSPFLSLTGLARRGSTPAASGYSTPSGYLSPTSAQVQSPYFDYPSNTLSPSNSNGKDSTIVTARVCDDCHISLTVAASLAGIEISRKQLSASGALSPSMTGSTSTIASTRTSRSRQQSGQSTASSSGISLSGAGATPGYGTARSSPPTSDDGAGSPSTTVAGRYSLGSSSGPPPKMTAPPPKLTLPEYKGQTTKIRNPQPQVAKKHPHEIAPNRRIYQLVGEEQHNPPPFAHVRSESAGYDSTPEPDSFPSTIGSTPGQGWTWSTF